MKILIVEDRNDDRYLLETLLDYAGYEYVSTRNGLAGLKKLQQDHFDLILSDILMDEMDGYELCQKVKNDAHLAYIPFIFVTATYLTQADEQFALSLGADRFIKKPLNQTILYNAITEITQAVESDQYDPKKTIPKEEFNRTHMQQIMASMEQKTRELELMYETQQKMRKELQKSEQRYKNISMLASDYFYLSELTQDNQMEIKWIDGAFKKITGYETDYFKRMNDWRQMVFSNDIDIFNNHMKRAQTGLKTKTQYRIQTNEGEIKWLEDTFKPMADEADHPAVVILGSIKDITHQKIKQEEVELLAAAVESATESIVIADSSGDIEYVNPAFEINSGYAKQDVLGKNPRILKSEKNDPAIYKDIWETISSGQAWHGSFVNKRKDGSEYDVSGTIAPIKDGYGKIKKYIAVRRDVTHERVLEKQIRQKQKLESIGVLAGGIAHDFNNILTSIIGFSEINIQDAQDGTTLKEDLIEISTAGHRAQQLVQQILTFARKKESDFESVIVSDIIQEAIGLLSSALPSIIEIKTDIDSTEKIMADPAQLHQIIMNIVTNASHAIGEDAGTISISLKKIIVDKNFVERHTELLPGPHLVLEIEDTGCGMSKEVMARIFDPFFTTKKDGKGTGLGLSTVYGIVQSHKGSIRVYSGPGKGSVFKIMFPIATDGEQKEEDSESVNPQGGEHILFVDDEPSIVKVSTRILTALGYAISSSTSSLEALKMFKQTPDMFDLIITDMTMPKLNGADLARELVAIRKNIPVILCSGYSEALTSKNIKEMGIKARLTKPVSTTELSKTIREVLDNPH